MTGQPTSGPRCNLGTPCAPVLITEDQRRRGRAGRVDCSQGLYDQKGFLQCILNFHVGLSSSLFLHMDLSSSSSCIVPRIIPLPLPSTPRFSFASYHTFPSPSQIRHARHYHSRTVSSASCIASSPLFHHRHHMSSMFPLASRVHLSVRHAIAFCPQHRLRVALTVVTRSHYVAL